MKIENCDEHEYEDWHATPGINCLYSRCCIKCSTQQMVFMKEIAEQEKDELIKQYKKFSLITMVCLIIILVLCVVALAAL